MEGRATVIVLMVAVFAFDVGNAGFAADGTWTFGQERLANDNPNLLNWTEDVARIEIIGNSNPGTKGKPPKVEFRVLELLRAGYFPAPASAIWLGADVDGGDNWEVHRKNGTLDAWEAEPLVGPPVGTRALVLTQFDGEATMFGADGFFPDTPINRDTALRFAATEPLMQRAANAMFFAVLVLPIAALLFIRKRPAISVLVAAAAFPAFKLYDSRIPISANIRIDLVVLYPALMLSGAVIFGAAALMAFRHWKSAGKD